MFIRMIYTRLSSSHSELARRLNLLVYRIISFWLSAHSFIKGVRICVSFSIFIFHSSFHNKKKILFGKCACVCVCGIVVEVINKVLRNQGKVARWIEWIFFPYVLLSVNFLFFFWVLCLIKFHLVSLLIQEWLSFLLASTMFAPLRRRIVRIYFMQL
jgi:hypothetical protein